MQESASTQPDPAAIHPEEGKSETNVRGGAARRRRAALVNLAGGYLYSGIVAVQGLVLIPFYLEHIGTHLYGAWLASGDILAWLQILDIGLGTQMIQRIAAAHGRGDRQMVASYFATGLLMLLALILLIVLLAAAIAAYIPGVMGVEGEAAATLTGAFRLAAVAMGLSLLNTAITSFAMAYQRTLFINLTTVTATIFGIIATVLFLLRGDGLWAIPFGHLVRSGSLLLANGCYIGLRYRAEVGLPLLPTRSVFGEYARLSSFTLFAKVGNIAMSRSEGFLIAVLLRPELVTIFMLTRRAADIVRLLLERFGSAVFAGFAHLVGSDQRDRAARVHAEILTLYTSSAVLFVGGYLAVNQSFMALWVDGEQFGGEWLTFLIGLAVLLGGRTILLNYLYSATGRIVRSAYLLLLESVARLPLMVALVWWSGLPGLPLATLGTALVAGELTRRWIARELAAPPEPQGQSRSLWLVYLLLLGMGALLGQRSWSTSWLGLVGLMGAYFLPAVLLLYLADEQFRRLVHSALRRAGRLAPMRGSGGA